MEQTAAGVSEAQSKRRHSILALLFFSAGQKMTIAELGIELREIHGYETSLESSASDLASLNAAGLARLDCGVAFLSIKGRAVVLNHLGDE